MSQSPTLSSRPFSSYVVTDIKLTPLNVSYLVPRADEHGGVQRFAHDTLRALSSSFQGKLVDIGSRRLTQLWRTGHMSLEMAVANSSLLGAASSTRGLRLPARTTYHHWNVLSAANPLVPATVVTCHGNEIIQNRQHRLVAYGLHRAASITTPSHFTKDLLVNSFPVDESKVSVIHPGVPLSNAASCADVRSPISIGTLARFVPRKNISGVIKALRILKHERGVDFVYHLAGTGPLRNGLLSELAQANLTHFYWGPISEQQRLGRFLPGLDVFVSPSLSLEHDVEGFGIAYIEANAAGVPVVAATTGGSGDAFSEGVSGFAADPTNPESIADAVMRAIELRSSLHDSSRQWASGFSISRTARQFEAIYESLQ